MSPTTPPRISQRIEWYTILAGTALFTAGFLARSLIPRRPKAGVIPSPRTTLLPCLSKEEQSNLPYPPDALPGARDVETPFGTFRAYEWGPESGRKVLFIHGMSIPCVSLAGIAHGLVDKGCRVMLFDLPGCGYSDSPTDLQHDMRLFTSQILTILASSPLSWSSAEGGFALVGYSFGGGIGASFSTYFPNLVNSLTLIAPSGVIRDHHISITSRILYSEGVLPERILQRLVRRRLQTPAPSSKGNQASEDERADATEVMQAEVNTHQNSQVLMSQTYPIFTVEAVVNHQVLNHEGFVRAFMSSIKHGPIRHEHDRWRYIGRRLTEKNRSVTRKETVLIILGENDPIIIANEVRQDIPELLEKNVEFKLLPAGHEVPTTNAKEVVDLIWNHLQ